MDHNMHGHKPTEGNQPPIKGSQLSLAHSATLHSHLGMGFALVAGYAAEFPSTTFWSAKTYGISIEWNC